MYQEVLKGLSVPFQILHLQVLAHSRPIHDSLQPFFFDVKDALIDSAHYIVINIHADNGVPGPSQQQGCWQPNVSGTNDDNFAGREIN